MRLGVTLPHIGPLAGPDGVLRAARHAESLGYDSVWVADRLLYPVEPRTPFPGTPDGSFPESFRTVLDPVGTLTFVAAHTRLLNHDLDDRRQDLANGLLAGPICEGRLGSSPQHQEERAAY